MNLFVCINIYIYACVCGWNGLSYNLAAAGNLVRGQPCLVASACMRFYVCVLFLDEGQKATNALRASGRKARTRSVFWMHVCCGLLAPCWQTPKCFYLSCEDRTARLQMIQTPANENKAGKRQKCEAGKNSWCDRLMTQLVMPIAGILDLLQYPNEGWDFFIALERWGRGRKTLRQQ